MNKTLDSMLYGSQARVLINTYDFDRALVIYKRLITMDPKVQCHHYWWARMQGDQGKYRLSELKFREAIILNPHDFNTLNNMGIVLSKQEKYDEAISVFQRALQNPPRNYSLFLNLAITLTKKGDYEEALEWYKKALELRPSDEYIHNSMGYLCFLQGKSKEAILKFDDAIKHDLWYEMPFFNKAITFFCQSGMEEESKKAFESGLKALRGENTDKLRTLKDCMNNYNSEIKRVKNDLERDNLGSEVKVNLESVHNGLEYILGLLGVEVEKRENLAK